MITSIDLKISPPYFPTTGEERQWLLERVYHLEQVNERIRGITDQDEPPAAGMVAYTEFGRPVTLSDPCLGTDQVPGTCWLHSQNAGYDFATLIPKAAGSALLKDPRDTYQGSRFPDGYRVNLCRHCLTLLTNVLEKQVPPPATWKIGPLAQLASLAFQQARSDRAERFQPVEREPGGLVVIHDTERGLVARMPSLQVALEATQILIEGGFIGAHDWYALEWTQ